MGVKEQISLVKDETVLEKRIQIYRLHYWYLRTCLKYKKEFQVDRSKYKDWNLTFIENQSEKTTSFNIWWKKIGRNLFTKKTFNPKLIKSNSINHLPNSLTIQISKDAPIEYNILKIRELLGQEKDKKTKDDNQRNHHLKLEIYLDTWLLDKRDKLSLRETRRRLVAKRKLLVKQRGKRVSMDKWKTQDFLKYDPSIDEGNRRFGKKFSSIRSLQRQINRYRLNAHKILNNVCKGEFPGQYTTN